MTKFKVGDWVRAVDPKGKMFSPFKYAECQKIAKGYTLVFWQPEEGEWCWFHEEGNPCCPMLKQFERVDINGYPTPYGMVRGFKQYEPFNGELPTFLRIIND